MGTRHGRSQALTAIRDKLEWFLLITIGGLLAAILYAYLDARQDLRREYAIAADPIAVPADAAALAEGERLTVIRGCFWCHGPALEGKLYFANANNGIIYTSPNLTRLVRDYTPAEFARAVRHGVRKDGTSLQVAMPAYAFYNISDAELGAMIAYIRSLPPQPGYDGEFRLLPVGWLRWLAGKFPPPVAGLIDHTAPRPDPDSADPAERGRYLSMTICETCHSDAGRLHFPGTPDLAVAAAYTREDFSRLLRTGVGVGGRTLNYEMQDSAVNRFVRLTDDEVDALYAYLQQRAGGGFD
jgi:mono/diheme cytochrome c family protein